MMIGRAVRASFATALLFTLAATVALSSGCATTRSRADDAYAQGDFARAAALYEEVVAHDPADAEARANLTAARTQALSAMLVTIDSERRQGRVEDALSKLHELLRTRSRWEHKPDERVQARITTEVTWATALVRAEVMRLVSAGLPLSAEATLTFRGRLLGQSEFAAAQQELQAAATQAGQQGCARLTPRAGEASPYFTRLVAAYCHHFRAAAPPPVPLPHLVSSIDGTGRIEGLDGPQHARFLAELTRWLHASLWYSPTARRSALATVAGRQSARFRVADVTLTRPWVESIPYQATESYQEPYQESYLDTEYYSEQVPYTDYETTYRPCGSGRSPSTCPERRAVTRYRSEQRSRLVRRYRTAYRTAFRTVTRYREEPRVFTFSSRQHTGEYESAFTVRVDLGEGIPPLGLASTGNTTQVGQEHDATFPQANVSPSRPSLMTADAWLSQRLALLEKNFEVAAQEHWKTTFCRNTSYAIEHAARCAYARAGSYPAGVRAALATELGEDVDQALALER